MLSRKRRHLIEVQEKVVMYLRLQRFQNAEELVRTALGEMGPLPNLLNLMGVVYHRQSLFTQAIEYFEQARAANPSFVEASLNLAVTLSDLGFYEQSERIYNETMKGIQERERVPDLILGRLANLHNATAVGYEEAGLLDLATQEFSKALSIFPRMPDVRLRLAKLYLRMGHYQRSKEQLLILTEENPSHTESLNLLGAVCYRMGDLMEARRCWTKSQNINPHDKTSRTYIRSLTPGNPSQTL